MDSGSGVSSRITQAEAGADETSTEVLGPLGHDRELILTPKNTLEEALDAFSKKDWTRLFNFTAYTSPDGTQKPDSDAFSQTLDEPGNVLETYSVVDSNVVVRRADRRGISQPGDQGRARATRWERTNIPVKLVRESYIWKVSYISDTEHTRKRGVDMKKVIAAALAVCILLSGLRRNQRKSSGGRICAHERTRHERQRIYRPRADIGGFISSTRTATLTAEPHRLVVETGDNPAAAAVKVLLAGPAESSGLKGVAPLGMELESIEFSRQVANVYLRYSGEPMQHKDQYILKLAIANTVTDILGATYICVFINGLQTGFTG